MTVDRSWASGVGGVRSLVDRNGVTVCNPNTKG